MLGALGRRERKEASAVRVTGHRGSWEPPWGPCRKCGVLGRPGAAGGGGALQELKLISEALAGGPCRGLRNEWSLHRIPGDREAA